ncbi:hypothetical protein GHT06_009009 [Daphnia sinensis]|uniref:Uncharacterized protein n=1 Tax=Daphnia sinensis TaxID=1820382 RepID=A0AAD5LM46_9CRUS|nr:hypothetical protein GHT06_009009 [Daphnia sinensis]
MGNGQRTSPLGRVELTITIGVTTIQVKVLVPEMRGINLRLGNDVLCNMLRHLKKLEIEYGTGKPKMVLEGFGELPALMTIGDETPTPTTKIVPKKWKKNTSKSNGCRGDRTNRSDQTNIRRSPLDSDLIEPTTNRTSGPTPGKALMPSD